MSRAGEVVMDTDEPRSDLLMPWCQQIVRIRGGKAIPCGAQWSGLKAEVKYGALYNFCSWHQTREPWVAPEPPKPWWRRLLHV